MPELRVSLDAVSFVIAKARELEVQEDAVEEDYGSDVVDDRQGVLPQADEIGSTYDELKGFIDDLNVDEQIHLVALVWLGRGDYALDQWRDAVADAAGRRTGPTSTYLLGIPILADYLEEGLAAFGLSATGPAADIAA